MSPIMDADDIRDFCGYLVACTDAQVLGVAEKERAANRWDYYELAKQEAGRRGLDIE